MNTSMEELKTTLAGLTVHQRVELAEFLLDSVQRIDEVASQEWLTLAETRTDEIRAEQVACIPAEKVLESLRRPQS